VKRRPSEYGLALAGLGLALATLVLDQAGVELPTWLLILLGLLAAAMIVGGLLIPHSNSNESAGSKSSPCEDLKRLRRLIANSAEPLAYNLENFHYWWAAVGNPNFDGRLPTEDGGEGLRVTHAEAIQLLLHNFARFFSAAYTYERCPDHRPLKPMQKLYRVLGDDQGGPTDHGVTPPQLQVPAIRSTPGWETAEARPFEPDEFQSALENDPQFAQLFKPLEEFLLAAAPNTEARARLEAAGKAVRRVEERLDPNVLRAFRVAFRLIAEAVQSSRAAISSKLQV